MCFSGEDALAAGFWMKGAADARVGVGVVGVGCGVEALEFLVDVLAGAEAGVEEAEGFEVFEGGLVGGEAVGLAEGGVMPVESEPF